MSVVIVLICRCQLPWLAGWMSTDTWHIKDCCCVIVTKAVCTRIFQGWSDLSLAYVCLSLDSIVLASV